MRQPLTRFILANVLAVFFPALAADWEALRVPTEPAAPRGELVYYRCFLRVPDNMTSRAEVDLWSDSAMLSFGKFPGRFTVFLNGQKIAGGESLPQDRVRFKVPKGILEKKLFNVLAVRLEGESATSGMRVAPVLHGYHDELVLEGEWEMFQGEPAPVGLRPVSDPPRRAFFTEKNFREASTPLAPNLELVRGERLSPAESLAKTRAGEGLAVDLLLHEPRVAQPTHFSFDGRGRLWVAQYRQYPYPAGLKMISRDKYYRATFDRVPPAPPNHDRGRDVISVHEDSDGDGRYDRHREVLTGLNMANAVLHGHGGIWVMHTPYLLFYPDANGDDVPDRDPEVHLAGFGLEDTHSIANGLVWGMDGWIYGAQGSTTTSRVLRPGIDPPGAPGVYYESCMVWRYHPRTRVYEIFAEGGGNNFGLEIDAEGRIYTGHNGGETRGWHFVQSGIYLKQGKDPGKFGPPTNPFAFGELPMMRASEKITRFSHHFAVAEGTALPEDYRGRIFAADPLHHNVVVSARNRADSTFATKDLGFALESSDRAFRPVFAANAPDGAIYVADFYEQYIAHGQNYQGQIDPDSGRIYRIRGKDSKLERDIDLARKPSLELVAVLRHPNKWHRQTAVRLLGERRDPETRVPLGKLLLESAVHPALEALWALHQAGWLDDRSLFEALGHPAPPVRAWAIRLAGDRNSLPPEFAAAVAEMTAREPDSEVRCQIASTTSRLPAAQALPLVRALLRRDADGSDPFIPLLCWWAIERLCDGNRQAVLETFLERDTPHWNSRMSREHLLPRLMRRFASKGTRADLAACVQLLNAARSNEDRKLLIAAFEEAFKGRPMPVLPEALAAALAEHSQNSLALRVRQRDDGAIGQALAFLKEAKGTREDRVVLVRALGEARDPGIAPALLNLLKAGNDLELSRAILGTLSQFEDPMVGKEIAALYPRLDPALQTPAQALLSARASWSIELLRLIEQKVVNAAALAPDAISRIRRHPGEKLRELAEKYLPKKQLRPDARLAIARIEQALRSGAGNPYAGEPIFNERCAACHQLFHKGGRVGPNLTFYQREDLGTILPSIVDPSAEIREGFVNYLVETRDGRALSGFIADQDANVIVLRGFDGTDLTIARAEITELKASEASLMPEGLLDGLSDAQLRDLFAYLRIPQPISR